MYSSFFNLKHSELCAGIIDKEGKSIHQIAKEEILEEVGFDLDAEKDIELINSYRVHQGINGAMQYLFFAELDESKRVSQGICFEVMIISSYF